MTAGNAFHLHLGLGDLEMKDLERQAIVKTKAATQKGGPTSPRLVAAVGGEAGGAVTPEAPGMARGWPTTDVANRRLPRWKRALDLALIAVSLPVALPVMLSIAVTIKLVSRGPVLFVQRRVGHGRRQFSCLKFRTMHLNTAVDPHVDHLPALIAQGLPLKKEVKNEARVIPLGRWIRAAGLDELPQLWNIARGEMSFVGPRPCTVYELSCYQESDLPRFQAVPGLTGLWQVSGKNDTTFAEMIRYDLEYLQKCSFRMDLKILGRTPATVLKQVVGIKAAARRQSNEARRNPMSAPTGAKSANRSPHRVKVAWSDPFR